MPHPATVSSQMPAPMVPEQVAACVAQYEAEREKAFAAFVRANRVEPLLKACTHAADGLLSVMAAHYGITLAAVGGYGRRALFPYSDLDVLLLVPDEQEATFAAATALVQALWDMHLPIAQSVYTLEQAVEAAQGDATIVTSLMELRLIHGDARAVRALKKRLNAQVVGQSKPAYVEAKLRERETRHRQFGDSRFVLEPHIKNGKGGLRDLQTLQWIARYCYPVQKAAHLLRQEWLSEQEWRQAGEAYVFYALVRAHMHLLRGRADERLTFDLQNEIAKRLKFSGHTAEEKAQRLMRRYFHSTRQIGSMTRRFCAVLEMEGLKAKPSTLFPHESIAAHLPQGLVLREGKLIPADVQALQQHLSLAITLFTEAELRGLEIHSFAYVMLDRVLPEIGPKLVFEREAHRQFLRLLVGASTPERGLQRMDDAGVLAALIPEFARIQGMMQYDGYHTYTVDAHSVVAVGNLAAILRGEHAADIPLASRLRHDIEDRAPLMLAMFCHDLAKGRGGAHAEKGGDLVAAIATRMGLSEEQRTLAVWLVTHQELLSDTAFRRDVSDAQTLRDFVAIVQSPERLRLLLLLTVSDIRAVGPTIWNAWKGSLMRDLTRRALAAMGVVSEQMGDVAAASLSFPALPLPAQWWSLTPDVQEAATALYAQWEAAPHVPVFVLRHDTLADTPMLLGIVRETPSALRLLAGTLATFGSSILHARSLMLGEAMLVQFMLHPVMGDHWTHAPEAMRVFAARYLDAETGAFMLSAHLPPAPVRLQASAVPVPDAVFIDTQLSATATVVEVNTRDRLGLFYDLLGGFEECRVQVMSAQLATYGQKAVDVFYVRDAYGLPLTHPAKRGQLQRVLHDICHGSALDYTI